VKTGFEPGREARLGRAQIDAAHPDGVEPEFPAPSLDALLVSPQRGGIRGRLFREVPMIDLVHPADDSGAGPKLHLPAESDTTALGAALAAALRPGLVIYLQGDLGAGKTTLVRGLLRALGHSGSVKSPTYTLIEPYVVSRLDLYHFDFYRFTSPDEFIDAGLDEYFAGQGACLVEWPDKAQPYLAPPDLEVSLTLAGSGRQAELTARTEAGRTCLNELMTALQGSRPAG
jgi:tRNA threonylcarbamoyladenosine biosynthesis protein TsaE